ncbi:MAG: tetratricopeptide repeat protein [Candidatus Omnitrophica bacterium]|nr:tetratricopeptide repeat protein [Candidatus Omnitrophota bacterium]
MKKVAYIAIPIVIIIGLLFIFWLPLTDFANEFWRGYTDVDRPAPHFNELALKLAGEGDYEGALTEIDRALERFPDSAILYQNRGRIYEKLGEYNEASDNYAQTITLDPSGEVGSLAYYRLKTMAETLEQQNEQSTISESAVFFQRGIEYFDKGIALYNKNDLDAARENLQLTVVLFDTALSLNPGEKQTTGFLYMAKGLSYFIIGKQYAQKIKSNDSNYTVMEWFRRAYHPLSYAANYYARAKDYLTTPRQQELLKSYVALDDKLLKVVKKYILRVDYEGRNYLKNMKIETQCVVDLDVLNTMINTGKYEAVPEFVNKRLALLKKLDTNESKNAVGISYLFRSYLYLNYVLEHMDKDPEWIRQNKEALNDRLNACMEDLETAQRYPMNESLEEFLANIANLAQSVRQNINKIGE